MIPYIEALRRMVKISYKLKYLNYTDHFDKISDLTESFGTDDQFINDFIKSDVSNHTVKVVTVLYYSALLHWDLKKDSYPTYRVTEYNIHAIFYNLGISQSKDDTNELVDLSIKTINNGGQESQKFLTMIAMRI